MTSQEALATPDVVTGTLSIFGDDAHVLIDPGATHSFISREYVTRVEATPVPLGCGLEVATPTGESLWPSQMLKGSLFSIEGQDMEADLIVIDLKGLDVILGMDWLASNYSSMDCFRKEVMTGTTSSNLLWRTEASALRFDFCHFCYMVTSKRL